MILRIVEKKQSALAFIIAGFLLFLISAGVFFGFPPLSVGQIETALFISLGIMAVAAYLLVTQKLLKTDVKRNHVLEVKNMAIKRLGNDFIGEPILLAFDEQDVAEESLMFLKNYLERQNAELSSYDHLFEAIHDPHYGAEARKEIIDLMNSIAPKGCKLKEIKSCTWGFA